ncbi:MULTISPECIES: alpha/beta fold hydrolase [unclassified Kitasatospora]|uniref:alpha/beta fold hydrolase n=1 Tax=unclassified Kitasatospora TaxID=2633591 RepID=UPI00071029BA|nr:MULTISPECIES: alpha/beta hydrolase [unclassified Kitasatospora]KQV15834.1 epoxide hydrolase [Kitasatospora sp. Root107]KRB65068.1 epoxide hydrolase [Kitasatospora sp. Root187]
MSDPQLASGGGVGAGVGHRFVQTNGIRMHIAEQGEGPLVVLLHGFPETWYSWRHQFAALAGAGYRVVAPDQRGYGRTDRPGAVEQYSQLHLAGDITGLLDALGEEQAVLVGHDWGSPVAWNTALLRPDRVRGVVALGLPYLPRGPVSALAGLTQALGPGFYMNYLQQPGVADAELARDAREGVLRFFRWGFGDSPQDRAPVVPVVPEGGTLFDLLPQAGALPGWLTEADLGVYAEDFARTGFSGGLNWWRTMELSWELTAPWQGAPMTAPALHLYGERDGSVQLPGMDQLISNLQMFVPNLTRSVALPGVGHWTQQERPQEVNAELLKFLAGL